MINNKNFARNMFLAESEGLLDTRESRIQRIIRKIKNYPEREVSELVFCQICEECGIQADDLTNTETARIIEHIRMI